MLAMLADSGDLRILPHTDELILATIAFGILVVFLLKAVFPRLKKALEDRTAKSIPLQPRCHSNKGEIEVRIWRVIFLVLLFCGGLGLIAYIILAICMPPPAKTAELTAGQ